MPDFIVMISTLKAFRHHNFRLFFGGQLVSLIGTWSQILAISWLVWRLTGSAAWLGATGFALQMPMLILGLFGGAAADRFDRLNLLNFMQVLCMLQAIALAWLTFSGKVELWQIIVLDVVLGTIYAFEFPVRQSFVMDMVGKADLLNANSLVSGMFHMTRLVGPVLAGVIVAWKGESVCFLANAASFLFLIVSLLFIDRSKLHHVNTDNAPMFEAIKAGINHARGIREVKLSLFLVAVIAGIGMQFTTLMPVFAEKVFAGGAVELGWLMGAGALGSLAGAVWLAGRSSTEKLLMLAARMAISFSIAIMGFALMSKLYLALGLLMVTGLSLTVLFSSVNTLLQHATPDDLRGRVMSLFTMTFMGLGPFGSLIAGFIAKAFGAPVAVVCCGAVSLVTAVFVLVKSRGQALTM